MDLYWGISWKGLGMFALIMLPNIFYFMYPPMKVPDNRANPGVFLNILENVSRMAALLLLMLLVSDKKASLTSPYLIFMAIALGLYYYLWIRYFTNGREYELLGRSLLLIPDPMAVFPVLFLLLGAIWLNNLPAAAAVIIFGAAHIAVTGITYHT